MRDGDQSKGIRAIFVLVMIWAVISPLSLLALENATVIISAEVPAAPTAPSPMPAPTGGGGGGGYYSPPPPLSPIVLLSGLSYPAAKMVLLRDAQILTSVVADSVGRFEFSLKDMSPGDFLFSLRGEDQDGRASNLLTFPMRLAAGTVMKATDILLAPTLAVDKQSVLRGDPILINGQSTPGALISLYESENNQLLAGVTADPMGRYTFGLDTATWRDGLIYLRTRAAIGNTLQSSSSYVVGVLVGTKTVLAPARRKKLRGDVNDDGRVNIVDFSLVAYWYKRPKPPARVDLVEDGVVNLQDMSILAYFWTG